MPAAKPAGITALPGSPLVAVPSRHGTFLCSGQDMIGRMLTLYGEWAEQEVRMLSRILRPGDVAVDVGAHIGTVSLAMARAVGDRGCVLAFEAQRMVHNVLCANIAINGLLNVHAFNAIVADRDGGARLNEQRPADWRNSGSFAIPAVASSPASPRNTPKVRLDSVLATLDRCRVVKMDIEGAEPLALDGFGAVIGRLRPALYIEANREDRFLAVKERLDRLGYRAWWHCEPHFNPANFRGETRNIYGPTTDINLLALPADAMVPEGLREARDFADVAHLAPPATGTPG
ncbi:FkbM family methyltransferase [Azospirillum sp.]|uniref:FkbM family methyltransferase n=1 Tax=Azospirillum sp. TaxID=34012 RepID=UPI002D65D263|nr:FkbM family methyltransferase [Azospirillum sp.]HYD70903.1 FkbM family methyltransferase [Azospirillum sp.]